MTKHILKLYTAETEYLEMAISKKEFQTFADSGVTEDALEKLEDHPVYCAPFFDERSALLLDDKEIAKGNEVLRKLYDVALEEAQASQPVRKPSKKCMLISERYIKRAWYSAQIEGKFDPKKLSIKVNFLDTKEADANFVSYRVSYDDIELQFEENFGASSSETYLRNSDGELNEARLASDEDDSDEWLGSEEDALSEIIAAGRDDWNTDDLVEGYAKETAVIKILSSADSKQGFIKHWRFAKDKKKFFYDTCRKWPVELIAIDDPDNLNDLKSYDESTGLNIYSRSLLPESMVAAKNFDEEDLAQYRDNTDPRFEEFASPKLSEADLKKLEDIYPRIKEVSKSTDWVEVSEDAPSKERDTLLKFEQKFPDDCFGRMANDTWFPTGSSVKITGPISYSTIPAQVIEIRTQQPELLPVEISEQEFADIQKNGVSEDIERELDWAPGMRIDRLELNPVVFNDKLRLYVNGQEVPDFVKFCKDNIEPLFEKQRKEFDAPYALLVRSPEQKRKAYFTLKSYQKFDLSKLTASVDYVFAHSIRGDSIKTIKFFYAGTPFVLDVYHTSPERKVDSVVCLETGEITSL